MAKRIRSKEQHVWIARDGRRAVLAAMLLIFVGAASVSDGKLVPDFMSGRMSPPETQPSRGADDGLRTGSILIAPTEGNVCEHRLIDNETWRIRQSGTIVCDAAVTWHPDRSDAYTSQSRIEAIREGFVSKR